MITISLDEYGNFEEDQNKPLFVAGLVFDDKKGVGEPNKAPDITEVDRERLRIAAYYKKVLADVDASYTYPKYLHHDKEGVITGAIERAVKTQVEATFAEFIQKGTYDGKPLSDNEGKRIAGRLGEYHIFVILKSDDGKKQLLSQNASIFVNDNHAANRYFHMAGEVVNRIVFHNPLYPGDQTLFVNLDIATRSSDNIDNMSTEKQKEFSKQGFQKKERQNTTQEYYSIMNADVYRTLIAQEMLKSGHSNVKIANFHVSSIDYEHGGEHKEFLYLADSVCSILGYNLSGTSADQWLMEIVSRAQSVTGKGDNLIFGYDSSDNDFSRAWSNYENKHYFDALSEMYDARKQTSVFAQHYSKVWFPYLEERIARSISPEYFSRCMDDLNNMTIINNLEQSKLLYLMQQFEGMVERLKDKFRTPDSKGRALYKLYDAGVSAFCHIGDSTHALECFHKAKEYAHYAGIDAYLILCNKLVVCLEDSFEWEKAGEIAEEDIFYQQYLTDVRKGMLKKDDETVYLEEAKAFSQRARVYAEQRNPKAEEYFRTALGKLQKGSVNYKITQSYLLHYYADMGMKEAYEAESADYFEDNKTANQRLKYIMDIWNQEDSIVDSKYALYVLIRGMWVFDVAIDSNLWTKIAELPEKLKSKSRNVLPGGHPWEIIYKYLRLMAYKQGDLSTAERFKNYHDTCMKHKGVTIDALLMFGEAEIATYLGKINERDQITASLVRFVKEHFDAVKDCDFSEDGDIRYKQLGEYFTYMYR